MNEELVKSCRRCNGSRDNLELAHVDVDWNTPLGRSVRRCAQIDAFGDEAAARHSGLTREEATEVFYAVVDKVHSLEAGSHGLCTCGADPETACDAPTAAWLVCILKLALLKLGPDGSDIVGAGILKDDDAS